VSPDTLPLTLTTLLGLAFGSFFNVCIHRVPRGLSVWRPGSRCPGCGYALRWYDNIPVLSYAMLGARCRKCHAPISMRYPIVELVTCGLFVLHYVAFGWTPLFVARLAFASALLVLFAIDLEHHLLPDRITLPGIVVGLACSIWLPPGIRDALIGAAVGGGVLWLIGEAYFRYSGHEGMGGGDVKMLAMIGAFLGWKLVLLTLVLSSLAGSIVGVAVIAARRGDMKYALPYGTFLSLGALVASLAGDRIVAWYLSYL
jgi:leader peptidase (prepilin peptidase)/N-methyltransferase